MLAALDLNAPEAKPIVKLLQGSPGTQEQAIHALAAVSEDVTHQQAHAFRRQEVTR